MLIWSGRREDGQARKHCGVERMRYLRSLSGQTADEPVKAATLWSLILTFLLPGYRWPERPAPRERS
jgi:hypothetical protein